MAGKKIVDFAAGARQRSFKVGNHLDARGAPDPAASPDKRVEPVPSLPENPRRRGAHGRGAPRRGSVRSGLPAVSPGHLSSWSSRHVPIAGEDDDPADFLDGFDICPVLSRTPGEEIEELEDEMANLGFDPDRFW